MTEDDQVSIYEAEFGPWPNCATPDCEHKCCTWSGTPYCFPCAERMMGREELIRQFSATHDITWDEAIRLDAED